MAVKIDGTTGFRFPDGTAAAPAETGTTSSTAGIFYPAANSVAISTSSTERLRVDSSGRVTKPYQPAFFASGSGGNQTLSTGSYFPFNTLYTTYAGSNRNSGFNIGTYLYTAPVTGLYQFYIQLYVNTSSTTNSVTWWKNGSQLAFVDVAQAIFLNQGATYMVVLAGSIILELAAGDYVGTQVRTGFGNVSVYMGHSAFWGYLIG